MIQPSHIHTLTEFKRNSGELIARLEASGHPQVLTVDGRAKVVVLAVGAFERLAALANRAETVEGIRRGLADAKAGRTVTLEEGEARLRKRLGLRRSKGSRSA